MIRKGKYLHGTYLQLAVHIIPGQYVKVHT